MKKKINTTLYFILIAGIVIAHGQERFVTKTGQIIFEASVPSFEEVKANNENVSAILKSETGEFASLALMKGFRFKVALMEEHFNENYAESSKYPKATFKGIVNNFSVADLSEENKTYTVSGTITMHGTDKKIEAPAMLKKIDDEIEMSLSFKLNPADFNIKIPNVVRSKIAEEVEVLATYKLKLK